MSAAAVLVISRAPINPSKPKYPIRILMSRNSTMKTATPAPRISCHKNQNSGMKNAPQRQTGQFLVALVYWAWGLYLLQCFNHPQNPLYQLATELLQIRILDHLVLDTSETGTSPCSIANDRRGSCPEFGQPPSSPFSCPRTARSAFSSRQRAWRRFAGSAPPDTAPAIPGPACESFPVRFLRPLHLVLLKRKGTC